MKKRCLPALLYVASTSRSVAHEGEFHLGDIPTWQLVAVAILIVVVYITAKVLIRARRSREQSSEAEGAVSARPGDQDGDK